MIIQSLNDSIQTSITLGIFSSYKIALSEHILNGFLQVFPISKCYELSNFNSCRLSIEPYPENNRPRGDDDIQSVLYHRQQIRQTGDTEPIWIIFLENRFILLDGVHRIVATYLENKEDIKAFVINSSPILYMN